MATLMNSFRSTQRDAYIGMIRWPDLRGSLLRATDEWLWILEGFMLRDRLSLDSGTWMSFARFLANFPGHIRTNLRMTAAAMDRIYYLQEAWLLNVIP